MKNIVGKVQSAIGMFEFAFKGYNFVTEKYNRFISNDYRVNSSQYILFHIYFNL